MQLIISRDQDLERIKQRVLSASDGRTARSFKYFSLPQGYGVIELKIAEGLVIQCSLCGVNIGYDQDGSPYAETIAYLTTVLIYETEKVKILREVVVCTYHLTLLQEKMKTD